MATKLSPADRFAAKVNTAGPVSLYRGAPGPCHLWLGAPRGGAKGQFGEDYGKFWIGDRTVMAHRFAYEAAYGEIPEQADPEAPPTVVDHRCRRRNCVNPEHLEAVTQQTNVRRGTSPAAAHARQTQCVNGHDLTDPANVRMCYPPSAPNGKRKCRTCERIRDRGRRRKSPATVATLPTPTATPERQAA